MKRAIAFLVLALSAACFGAGPVGPEQQLLDTDRAFAKAAQARRAAAWAQFMAEEAVAKGEKKPLNGKLEIVAAHERLFADPTTSLTWQPARAEMLVGKDLGYTTGDYELHTETPEGKKLTSRGQYITVWQKQKDGSWKVVYDAGSRSPEAPTSPSEATEQKSSTTPKTAKQPRSATQQKPKN
jgi:ketosteroid isomerase-like protein